MTNKEKTTELAVKDDAFLGMTERPDFLKEGDTRGNESVSLEDKVIPRLDIIQALSPCLKKHDPAYIEGAEEGMIYNNITRELYGREAYVCFADFEVVFINWAKDVKPRSAAFRGVFKSKQEAAEAIDLFSIEAMKAGKGTEIINTHITHQHFGVLINPLRRSLDDISISMSSSKVKVSKHLNTMVGILGQGKEPRFARVYRVSTVPETGVKGDYYNYKIEANQFATKAIFDKAEAIYNMSKLNKLKTAVDVEYATAETDEAADY